MLNFLADYYGWGTTALQLVVGLIFVVHGWPKFKNPAGIAGVYGAPKMVGTIHGLVEIVGGISLALGLWVEQFTAIFSLIILCALYFKIFKWKMPFMAQETTGWEFDLLLLAALSVILLG